MRKNKMDAWHYLHRQKLYREYGSVYEHVRRLLRKTSISMRIELGKRMYQHMANNPDFEHPVISMEYLEFVVDQLDMAWYEKRYGLTKEPDTLVLCIDFFDFVFATFCMYVASLAHGSENIYRSAGLAPVLRWVLKS